MTTTTKVVLGLAAVGAGALVVLKLRAAKRAPSPSRQFTTDPTVKGPVTAVVVEHAPDARTSVTPKPEATSRPAKPATLSIARPTTTITIGKVAPRPTNGITRKDHRA